VVRNSQPRPCPTEAAPPRPIDESPHGLSTAIQGLRYRLHKWASSVDRTGRECDGERARANAERLAPTVNALLLGVVRRYHADERLRTLDGDPRVPPATRTRVERERQEAQRAMYPHLRTVMREGLERWLGVFLRGEFYETYLELLANGAPLPEGLRVCESCALVFATRRKRGARRCAHCHHRPRARAPLTILERPSGGYVSRGLPGFNGGTRVVGSCEACGATFYAEQANRIFCSPACGKGRAPSPPAPGLTAEEREVSRAVAESIVGRALEATEHRRASGETRRIAACDRCAAYFATRDPATVARCPECS